MLPVKNFNTFYAASLAILLHVGLFYLFFLFGGPNEPVSLEKEEIIMTNIISDNNIQEKIKQGEKKPKPASLFIASKVDANEMKTKKKSNTKLETNSADKANLKTGKKADTKKQSESNVEDGKNGKDTENLDKELAKKMTNIFLKKMDQAIKEQWIRPANVSEEDNLITVLEMELNIDGTIKNLKVTTSSGNELFDRSALASIFKIGVFSVPSDKTLFEKNFKIITINFSNT